MDTVKTVLLDSTMREGELFRPLKVEAKVELAKRLAAVGLRRVELPVDYPPRTTREDIQPVVDALDERGVEVVFHGRALRDDLEAAAKYNPFGVALYISPTKIHRIHKLHGISYDEAVGRLVESVKLAKSYGFRYVRATVEDASRFYVEGEVETLVSTVKRLGEAGATLVSVPDTAGLLSPRKAADFMRKIQQSADVPLAAHFHNDYGMASSNTVESILEGVAEAHTTILGVGDRNGIADLYEVVATLNDVHGLSIGVERAKLAELYSFFIKASGIRTPWRHPLSEESKTLRAGVHQAMAVEKPEGYIPSGKLEHDFQTPIFHVGVYTSHRLVASLTGLEAGDPRVREATEALARRSREKSGRLTLAELRDVIKQTIAVEVDPRKVEKYIRGEKVYMLAKLNPRINPQTILSELNSWDDVEAVDEVYGDADFVVVGRMRFVEDNLVERFRKRFGKWVEDLKVLVAD
ncbi:MAG: hypothetical protein NZ570_01055 [Candidatus Caldarchaeum sp.]|nr:hypothetical protein [Candidatus Caldarchaeum sp.]MDW7978756.1 hypothetical protein [Candidatus Caldarchaeum sp.]MDW8360259.1 hypothetical protein [Candidatus Caldarchaeum sp.]